MKLVGVDIEARHVQKTISHNHSQPSLSKQHTQVMPLLVDDHHLKMSEGTGKKKEMHRQLYRVVIWMILTKSTYSSQPKKIKFFFIYTVYCRKRCVYNVYNHFSICHEHVTEILGSLTAHVSCFAEALPLSSYIATVSSELISCFQT